MGKEIDVYRDWLKITETARPLSYYHLLRLKTFEDDAARIRRHYQQMNAHVRKYATGDYAKQSQDLLNELAKAMLCLTDAQRKREYDASLGRKDQATSRRRTLEEVLLADKTIDRDQLDKARSYANAIGLEIRDALVQQKTAPADKVMLAFAESVGLPYIDLEDVGVDEQLAAQVPPVLARQHSCVPVMCDGGQLLMASPNPLIPDVEEELRLRFDMPVRTVLCTPASINAAVSKYYPRDAVVAAPVAPAKKAAPRQPAPAPKQAEEAPAAAAEAPPLQRRLMPAVVAFNIAVILCVILTNLFYSGSWTGMAAILIIGSAVLLGAIAGGVTFVVTKGMKL